MTGYTQRPAPGWLRSRVRGFEVLSNVYEPLTLDTVFPYQKSNCALILKNRACVIESGLRYVLCGVRIVGP